MSIAIRIRLLAGYTVKLGIIINLEFNQSVLHWLAIGIRNRDNSFSRRRVIIDHVDLGIPIGTFHDILRAIVFTEYFRMHQHTPVSRAVEPTQIQYRFGLASAEEIPFTIHPSFYPCVVIICMRPARRIYRRAGIPTERKAATVKVDSSPQRP